MMDRIILEGMTFFGRHGLLPREVEEGQPFVVDLALGLNLAPAGKTDHLGQTVDYSQVVDAVREVVEGKRFNLLEALAEAIAGEVLQRFPVESVRVGVKKPRAPLGVILDHVAVVIERRRGS